jgi:hypothetical protein
MIALGTPDSPEVFQMIWVEKKLITVEAHVTQSGQAVSHCQGSREIPDLRNQPPDPSGALSGPVDGCA